MKIIGKVKDYYDYLQGVWGMDEKLTLDRTHFTLTPDYRRYMGCPHMKLVRFYICGWVVEGLYYQEKDRTEGNFIYGKDIENFLGDRIVKASRYFTFKGYYTLVNFDRNGHIYVLKEPTKFYDLDHNPKGYYQNKTEVICPNEKLDCPILIQYQPKDRHYDVPDCSKFPCLSDYSMYKVYPAQQMWEMLTNWLSRENTVPNNQSNKERILSNGFDIKTSFRHPIK